MTTKIQHTQACLSAREKECAVHADYVAKWPNYCRKCGGLGGKADYEYRGEFHGTPASEPIFDYCPNCLIQLKCPRCGVEGINNFNEDHEVFTCFACLWKSDTAEYVSEILNECDCGYQ